MMKDLDHLNLCSADDAPTGQCVHESTTTTGRRYDANTLGGFKRADQFSADRPGGFCPRGLSAYQQRQGCLNFVYSCMEHHAGPQRLTIWRCAKIILR